LSGANQVVRVPLPNLKPGWLSDERTTSASNVPAGTFGECDAPASEREQTELVSRYGSSS
jgi:hypothetical protein